MTRPAVSEVTVGIDIGTSSVKAVAADADGNVVARSRVPHEFHVPSPLRFEHDAAKAWHTGPQHALAGLGEVDPRGVSVAAMVPSLTAVDDDGVPVTPGLLYGDERGRTERVTPIAEAGELMEFLRWQAGAETRHARLLDGPSGREPHVERPRHRVDDGCRNRESVVRLDVMGCRPPRGVRRACRPDARDRRVGPGARRCRAAARGVSSRAGRSMRWPSRSSRDARTRATCW